MKALHIFFIALLLGACQKPPQPTPVAQEAARSAEQAAPLAPAPDACAGVACRVEGGEDCPPHPAECWSCDNPLVARYYFERGWPCHLVTESCEETVACREYGMCRRLHRGEQHSKEIRGFCALTDDACAAHSDCVNEGLCEAGSAGRCVPRSDADCAKSPACRAGHGKCYLKGETCADRWYAGCEDGLVPRDGQCVPLSCDDVEDLRYEVQVNSPAGDYPPLVWCAPDESQRCEDTPACREAGFCGTSEGRCVQNDAGCASLPGCAAEGQCHSVDNRCVARDDATCAKSKACKDEGRCFTNQGECTVAANCDAPWVAMGTACRLPTTYDCATECREENRCDAHQFEENGWKFVACVQTAAFCKSQPACKQSGVCGRLLEDTSHYDHCNSTFPGACSSRDYGIGCVKTDAGCAKSVDCRKRGNCSAATSSRYCRPTRTEHCEQSEICKKEGQCRLLDESSYHICGD